MTVTTHDNHNHKAGWAGYRRFALQAAARVGSAGAFTAALLLVLIWAVTGPMFDYSDSWQLWINTGTTVITFLMVFIIQYTQNRDARAMHLKLDELLRAVHGARTEMVDLKDMSDEELRNLERAFERLARFAAHSRTSVEAAASVEKAAARVEKAAASVRKE